MLTGSAYNVQVGGSWLGWWMVAAAAASQVGQFEAEMSSDSFLLLGMAERGFLPAALARRSPFDTPLLGILLSSVGVLALSVFDFLRIVELLNIVYCLAELLEFVAFVWLRYKYPNLYRCCSSHDTLISWNSDSCTVRPCC